MDDFALLPFSEAKGHFKPGLETLILVGCRGVGDTGLSWLADGISECNVHLNLKGTRCTTTALRSVQDRWRYSDQKKNHAFFGLYPQRRWRDREIINEYGTRYKAARHIQAAQRGRVGRAKAAEVKKLFCKNFVANRLQSWWRGRLARELFAFLIWQRDRRDEAARTLQGFAKIIAAKERRRQLRDRRYVTMATRGAILIQRIYRGVLAKKRVARIRRALAEAARRLLVATEFVQRVFRGHQGRLGSRASRPSASRGRRSATAWRPSSSASGAAARCGSRRRRGGGRRRTRAAAELEAAVKVQGRYRTYRCRKIIGEAAAQRSEMIVAATRIQASYRAMVAACGCSTAAS